MRLITMNNIELIANIITTLLQISLGAWLTLLAFRYGMWFAIQFIHEANTDMADKYKGILAVIANWPRRLFLRELDKFELDVIKSVIRFDP